MIFKVRKHRSKRHLRNLIRYLLRQLAKSNERVLLHESLNALPMLPGENLRDYAKRWTDELWQFTDGERGGKKAPADFFVHAVMSFFPGSAEHPADQLTPEQAISLAKEAMAEVAPGERQTLYVVHGDKDHLHVHIAFSVVEMGGRIWNPREDFRLWEKAATKLEIKYGLYRVTVGRPGGEPAMKSAPTSGELRKMVRTEQPSDRMLLQQIIMAALVDEPTFPVFLQRLLDAEVTPIPVLTSQGSRICGISFRYQDGLPMKGSDLGKGFSWPALSKKTHYSDSYHMKLMRKFALERETPGGEFLVKAQNELAPVPEMSSRDRSVMRKFLPRPRSELRTDWVWRNKPSRTAFVESYDQKKTVYVALTSHPLAYEAIAIRAQQRGVKKMHLSGSDEFRKKAWLELTIRGIDVDGYEPSENQLKGLEFWKNEHAKTSRADDSAAVAGALEYDADQADTPPRRDAHSKCENERRVGGSDVSATPDNDLLGVREPDLDGGDERNDVDRGSRASQRAERPAWDVGGNEWEERFGGVKPRLNPAGDPLLQLRRVQRLGDASLLRQKVITPQWQVPWQECFRITSSLDRQFRSWSIRIVKPGQPPLAEFTRHDHVRASWSSLAIANTVECNVELHLPEPNTWLHLVGVSQSDLEWLSHNGISPTAKFSKNGVDEVFVQLSAGALSRKVLGQFLEEISTHLSATVSGHFGGISCPLPGFDWWSHDGELQLGSSLRLDSSWETCAYLLEWLRDIEEDFKMEGRLEREQAAIESDGAGNALSDQRLASRKDICSDTGGPSPF